MLSDTAIVMITCERAWMTRLCALAALMFSADRAKFLVLDDHSEDLRLTTWFETLAAEGVLEFHRAEKNIGIGRMRRWEGTFCSQDDWPEYTVTMDSDMLVGPSSFHLLMDAYRYWERNGKVLGTLGAYGQKQTPEFTDAPYQLLDRFCDVCLYATRSDLFAKYRDSMSSRRRRPFTQITYKMRKAGHERSLCVSPQIPIAHIGKVDALIGLYAQGKPPSYWGAMPPLNPLPMLFDPVAFEVGYPDSARELYAKLRDENDNARLGWALMKADDAAWKVDEYAV